MCHRCKERRVRGVTLLHCPHMKALFQRRILLGVSGGVAAYKAAELLRLLKQAGADVRVVMTRNAQQFVGAMTFQALSGHPVRHELMDSAAEAGMGHIELARWADAILIAPTSANTLARLAQGLADDLLSTLVLASRAPLYVAPAMNQAMWSHPATQSNVKTLQDRGVTLIGPATGEQACGDVGPGRMEEPAGIAARLAASFESGRLAGKKVVITAGPTREPIDPVRYLSNRSSGKMGYAIARAAREAGAEVILVSGPTSLAAPERVRMIQVETAEQMHAAAMSEMPGCAIFIAAAAVADYRPTEVAEQKIKKTEASLELALTRNPDILAEVSARAERPFCVGFAAETEALEQHAQKKRLAKGLDMVAANDVSQGQAFEREDNALSLFWEGGRAVLPRANKQQLADQLITIIADRYAITQTQLHSGEDVSHHAQGST